MYVSFDGREHTGKESAFRNNLNENADFRMEIELKGMKIYCSVALHLPKKKYTKAKRDCIFFFFSVFCIFFKNMLLSVEVDV